MSGGQFDWGGRLRKGIGGAQRFPQNGVKGDVINSNARISTKAMAEKKTTAQVNAERDAAVQKATEYYNKGVKPGSLAAKANMVAQYNNRKEK